MRCTIITSTLIAILLGAGSCHSGQATGGGAMALELSSNSFSSGENIPKQFTCDGEDRSPELHWGKPPAGTKSVALIADDPDAPAGTWVHWVIFNLPAATQNVPEGTKKRNRSRMELCKAPTISEIQDMAVPVRRPESRTGISSSCTRWMPLSP